MSAQSMTLEEIRQVGLEALVRELGPVGTVRFLQQFETGRGDYTVEREGWLNSSNVQTVVREIRHRRGASEG